MQNKYLSALKTKYASFGLSKEALDRVASQRVKTIANESEIDADVASSEVLLLIMKEMQGATDALRSNNAKIQKELDDLKNNKPTNSPSGEQEPDNEIAKQLQTLTNLVTTMQTERAAEKKQAQADAVIAEVHEIMKQKGCTNDFIRRATLSSIAIEEGDTAQSLAEKYKPVYDQNFKEAYGEGYVPPRGNGNHGDNKTDNEAETTILQKRGLLPKDSK